MRKLIMAVLASVGVAAFAFAGSQSAQAATPAGWGEWLLPTGTLCVQTQGSSVIAQAAANWNKSDAVIVASPTCAGYSRKMTVKFVGYTALDGACAKTGATKWSWENVRGVWSWVPLDATVWINYATQYRAGCRGTTGQVQHVYNHELGHWLGLAHNKDASVLNGWTYRFPTTVDIRRVNYRY